MNYLVGIISIVVPVALVLIVRYGFGIKKLDEKQTIIFVVALMIILTAIVCPLTFCAGTILPR